MLFSYIIGSILLYYHALIGFNFWGDSNKVQFTLKYPGETYKVRLSLPKGKRNIEGRTVQMGRRISDLEYRISFGGDSFIYIWGAISFSSPNIENIKNIGSEEALIRVSNNLALTSAPFEDSVFVYPDGEISLIPSPHTKSAPFSMVFNGIDTNGLLWKDIKIGKISIGYQNVQECDVLKYDKILNTIQIKHKRNHIRNSILISDFL